MEEVTRAMGVALQGIQLAQGSKRYAHLVYNGSVYFWQAARPLMRKDRWQHVHSKLGEVLAALKDLSGHIQWKATVSAAMAQCAAAVRAYILSKCSHRGDTCTVLSTSSFKAHCTFFWDVCYAS